MGSSDLAFLENLSFRAPAVRPLGNDAFQLLEPIKVPLIAGVQPFSVEIPAGFITDFASIPTLARWYVKPTHPAIIRASIVHDFLYSTHITSRQVADAIFYSMMRTDGMPRLKAKVCFRAVNLGGRSGYRKTSPERMRRRTPILYKKFAQRAPAYEGIVSNDGTKSC